MEKEDYFLKKKYLFIPSISCLIYRNVVMMRIFKIINIQICKENLLIIVIKFGGSVYNADIITKLYIWWIHCVLENIWRYSSIVICPRYKSKSFKNIKLIISFVKKFSSINWKFFLMWKLLFPNKLRIIRKFYSIWNYWNLLEAQKN